MPDPDQTFPSAHELLLAASALAKHLSDSGVQFLPIADAARVAELSENLRLSQDDHSVPAVIEDSVQ